MKKIITALFAIAAFTFSTQAQDQNKVNEQKKNARQQHGHHKGHGGKGMDGMENLNLTAAQRQQIKSINEDFKNKLQALNKNDNITVKDMKAQRKALMEDRKNKISAILTPEQKNQFEQLRKQDNREGEWKEKRKVEDGKEKRKIKTT